MRADLKYFEEYLGNYGFSHLRKLIFPPPFEDEYELSDDQKFAINYLIQKYEWEWCYLTGKETIKTKTYFR